MDKVNLAEKLARFSTHFEMEFRDIVKERTKEVLERI